MKNDVNIAMKKLMHRRSYTSDQMLYIRKESGGKFKYRDAFIRGPICLQNWIWANNYIWFYSIFVKLCLETRGNKIQVEKKEII